MILHFKEGRDGYFKGLSTIEWARELHEALSKAFEGISEWVLGRLLVFDEVKQEEDKRPTWTPVMDTRRAHQVLLRKPIHAPRKVIP